MPLLDIKNLNVDFPSTGGILHAVEGVTLQIEQGDVVGIVGESGSGKSVSMMAAMGLVSFPGEVRADTLTFEGRDLLTMSERERRRIVGKDIAMIFQEPTTSLNPSFTIGFQLMETLQLHEGMDKKSARRRAIDLLAQVGISSPESRLDTYPHQMSGGMNQRVMIAMAIACNPKILIADEPTTALDVTIQAQIIDLLLSLQRDRKMALILITHNMGVVADTVDRVVVMYAGQIVEERDTESLFASPQHPYTQALLAARPEACEGQGRLATIPGVVPGLYDRPAGCLFSPRCTYATPRTECRPPELRDWQDGRVRCHYPLGDETRDARIGADRMSTEAAS
jgi:dipeptide transport system ATP-binding protein